MVQNLDFEHKREFNEKWRRKLQEAAEIKLGISTNSRFDIELNDFLEQEASEYGLTQAHFTRELNGYLRKGREYINMQAVDLGRATSSDVNRVLAGIPASPELGIRPDKTPPQPTPPTGPSQLDLDNANDRIRLLEADKATLQQEKNTLAQEKQALEADKTTLQQEKNTLAQEKQALEADKTKLQQEKDALLQGNQALETEKRTLQQFNNGLSQRVIDLASQIANLTTTPPAPTPTPTPGNGAGPAGPITPPTGPTIGTSQKDLDDANAKIATLGADKDALLQRIADLERQIAATSKGPSQKDLDDASAKVQTLEAENTDLETKIRDFVAQIDQLKTDLGSSTAAVTEKNNEIVRIEKLKEAQSTKINELIELLSQKEQELKLKEGTETQNADLETKIRDFVAQIDQLKTDLGSSATTIAAKDKEIVRIEKLKESQSTTINELKAKLKVLEDKGSRSIEEVAQIRQKLEQATMELAEKDQVLEAANTEKTSLEIRLKELTELLSQKEQELRLKEGKETKNTELEAQISSLLRQIEQLKTDLGSSAATIAEKDDEIIKIKEVKEAQSTKINELQEKLRVIELEGTRSTEETSQIRQKLEQATTALTEKNQALEAANTEKAELEKRLRQFATMLSQAEKAIELKEAELASSKSEITRLGEQLTKLQEELIKAARDNSESKQALEQQIKDAKEILKNKEDDLKKAEDDLERTVLALDTQRERMEAEFKTVKSELERSLRNAESQQSIMQGTITSLEKNIGSITAEKDELQFNYAQEQQRSRKFEGEVANLSERIRTLEKEKVDALAKLERDKQEYNKLSFLHDNLEIEHKKLGEKANQLKTQNTALEARLRNLETEITRQENEISGKDEEITEFKSKVSILEAEKDDALRRFEEASNEIEEQNKMILDLTRESTELERGLNSARETIARNESRIQQLLSDLGTAKEYESMYNEISLERNNLKKSLDKYKADNEALQSKITELKSQIASLEKDLSDSIEAIRAIDRSRNMSEKEKEALAKKVEVLEENLAKAKELEPQLEKQKRLIENLDKIHSKDSLEIARLQNILEKLQKAERERENAKLHATFEANKQANVPRRPLDTITQEQLNQLNSNRDKRLGNPEITNDDLEG